MMVNALISFKSRRRMLLHIFSIVMFVSVISLPASLSARSETTVAQILNLEIRDRQVTSDEKVIRLKEGVRIQINWSSDENVEIHLHGYDIYTDVKKGEFVPMVIQAHTAGRFPITAHDFQHATLFYLEIYPGH